MATASGAVQIKGAAFNGAGALSSDRRLAAGNGWDREAILARVKSSMNILKLTFLSLAIILQGASFAQINLGGREFHESAVPLETIVSRYLAWRGGPAYERLSSFHAKSVNDPNGRPLAAEVWFDRSGRWRRDLSTQSGFSQKFGRTPKSSWVSDINGQIENDPSNSIFAYRLALIEFGDALRGVGNARVALRGVSRGQSLGAAPGQLEGFKDWAWVRVTFGDADTYDLLIDPITGALSAYVMTVRGQKYYSFFGDWRIVGGVRMAFWWITQTPVEGPVNLVISELDVNKPLSSSLFIRPGPSHQAIFDKGATSTGWIGFNLIGGSQIRFPIVINGHETDARLDNGAVPSVIDRAIAANIDLSYAPQSIDIPGSGASTIKGTYVSGLDIKVGNLSLRNLTAFSTDLSALAKFSGRPLFFLLAGC